MCKQASSPGLSRILRNLNHSADPRKLPKFYHGEDDALTDLIYLPFPLHYADTPRLIRDVIRSASRCQNDGQLLLISVYTDRTLEAIYDKEVCSAFARANGYELERDDSQLVELCVRFGWRHDAPKLGQTLASGTCTWVFRRT